MKQFFYHFLIALFGLMTLSACDSGKEEVKEDILTVSPTSLNVNENAQEAEITISSSAEPTVTLTDRSWCNYTKSAKGNNGGLTSISLLLKIAENTQKAPRSVQITILCGQKTQSVTITQAASTKVDPQPQPSPSGSVDFAMTMGLGWNLGNQMDSYSNGVANETCWGNKKCTQATMDALKTAGITTVRIPVTWLGKVGEAPEYKIDADWLNRVAEIVGYAKNAGLKAIVNIHHDGSADSKDKYNGWLQIGKAAKDATVNTETKAKIKAMWSQIATKFQDEGDYLIFEAFNEIHDGGWGWGDNKNDGGKQYKILNEWNQTFVDAVRAAGGKNTDRYLGIPAYDTNIDIACEDSFVLPKDPTADHLMVAVHDYDPYKYTLEAEYGEWGHTGAKGKKPTEEESVITNAFKKINNKFVSKGIAVYIGEFNSVNRKDEREQKFQEYYLEYFVKAAKDYKLPCIIWDNGSTKTGKEANGYFDHATGAFIGYSEQLIKTMVNAWINEDSAYTLKSVYDNAPK